MSSWVPSAWQPVRYVHADQVCVSWHCRRRIPKGAPGHSTGTRGTKAFFNRATGGYMCLECHAMNVAYDVGCEELDRARARAVPWQPGMTFDAALDARGHWLSGFDRVMRAQRDGRLDQLVIVRTTFTQLDLQRAGEVALGLRAAEEVP